MLMWNYVEENFKHVIFTLFIVETMPNQNDGFHGKLKENFPVGKQANKNRIMFEHLFPLEADKQKFNRDHKTNYFSKVHDGHLSL